MPGQSPGRVITAVPVAQLTTGSGPVGSRLERAPSFAIPVRRSARRWNGSPLRDRERDTLPLDLARDREGIAEYPGATQAPRLSQALHRDDWYARRRRAVASIHVQGERAPSLLEVVETKSFKPFCEARGPCKPP